MKTYTVAQITDFGPGLTTEKADDLLRRKLLQAVDYYLREGIEGERFTKADIGETTFIEGTDPFDRALRRRTIEAEVTFA